MAKKGKGEKEDKSKFSSKEKKKRKLRDSLKQIHRREIILAIAVIALIVLISVNGIPKTDKQLEKERKEACLENNGIFYEGNCLTFSEIINWSEECKSRNETSVFLRYDWGGEDKCFNQTFIDEDISNSTQEQVAECTEAGGTPVVTNEVLCVDMNSSSDSSELEYIEGFSEE